MTHEELLREVARVAPKEMGAEFKERWGPMVVFHCIRGCQHWDGANQYPTLILKDDLLSGAAVITMLNAMEEAGLAGLTVSRIASTGEYLVCDDDDTRIIPEIGATRAEAVSRAFCAVFSTNNESEVKGS